MTFEKLRPMLWTEKMDETIAFYCKILGFICAEKDDSLGWASLYKNDVEIMLAKPNAHEDYKHIGFSGSFYITVDDVDALWLEIKDKVKICYPIEDFSWNMREFAIYDNNGYILQFGQEIS